MARVLITGGAGFIGSHTCVRLIEDGHDLIVIDSFVNSCNLAIQRVKEITGIIENKGDKRLELIEDDIRNRQALSKVFNKAEGEGRKIDAVIHFAGLKSVQQSLQQPLNYWDVNVNGTNNLLSVMHENNCRTLIFSSSATIYGTPKSLPITEDESFKPINPYGNTKEAVEKLLIDVYETDADWRIATLRYFNPVGAHPSGKLGESPSGIPSNLFPFLSQVASGRQKILKIFGGDWPTPDKTCIRDYIHIMDLAEGHLAALQYLLKQKKGLIALNLGSGKGHSVLEVVNSFIKATGITINYQIVDRRPGDTAETVADPTLAKQVLGWKTVKSLSDMCCDSWRWQKENPNGYPNVNSL